MLPIFLQKSQQMLLFHDGVVIGQIAKERQRAEERVGGQDLADALLGLLTFGEGEEENRKHFVDLGMLLFAAHIR